MHDIAPRLLVVAHGTASRAGAATTARLVAAISHARPSARVDLCFLDVAAPDLPTGLDATTEPTVVVPLLLSTGYHVQTDIPAAVDGRPWVRIARHLGPHPLLVDALVDRLGPVDAAASTVLVGAGSSRGDAADELAAVAVLLGERRGRHVTVLTMADDLRDRLSTLDGPAEAATYLLAEGRFVSTLQSAATGLATVSPPLGTHPALVELVWLRYDEAAGGTTDDGAGRTEVVR